MGARTVAKSRLPRKAPPDRAAREHARATRRSEAKRRREAAHARRLATRHRRRAARRARLLRLLVALEVLGRRIGRIIVPAHTRRLPRGKAILILALNVVPLPGLGTVIYGKLERGIAQFLLTFIFLLGWMWAVGDGIRIVNKAYERDTPRRQATPLHPRPPPRAP